MSDRIARKRGRSSPGTGWKPATSAVEEALAELATELERTGAGAVGNASPAGKADQGGKLVAGLMDAGGLVLYDQVAEKFGMSKRQLAETLGFSPETLQRTDRMTAPRTQSRVTEMLEIIARIADWAGGEKQAMAWYRAEPIPAFGGRTAESLLKDGKAAAVRDYLDHISVGGFA